MARIYMIVCKTVWNIYIYIFETFDQSDENALTTYITTHLHTYLPTA